MLRKRESQSYDQIDTVIGAGTVFQGTIHANGTIRIDGGLKGDVITKGDIIVGDSGKIEGNLEARNILIAGQIQGNVGTTGKLEVAASGRIMGDLTVGSLVIDDGAVFQGHCRMESSSKPGMAKKELKPEKA
ncbi:MAG: polymer-forming cytoskeletal protein [Clostridia bacterium]|nr:polymer-forming cytoskeletal protein [Clostridia bacterium]